MTIGLVTLFGWLQFLALVTLLAWLVLGRRDR